MKFEPKSVPAWLATDVLITAREAQRRLGIKRTTLYKWINIGWLTPIRFGVRCTRFRLSQVLALIAEHDRSMQVTAEVANV